MKLHDFEIDEIKRLGLDFRQAIMSLPLSKFPNSSFFENFPRGCCGDTCHLFAKYLMFKGYEVDYVWGWKGKQSHAWLEHNNLIVDLTADQFSDIDETVVVTCDKSWYNTIQKQQKSEVDFEKFDGYNHVRLKKIYNNILEILHNEDET
ncbi:hypothetical protein [Paenibacillus sp. NAIST15-1]|uniref:hypothetical protein n=1 Tax=Paenibacillus sp. NAIST15-1 TaxID=1605994 RepID=UPI0008684F7A|nr:hypothetical protein [Paenibacillus sp. NAIST15-1]GAV11371.1 hypothetical protein PBN151_1298 [Paenibacillus sp. NAIST15-1]